MLSSFHVMLKPRGSVCNLACAHCYYLSKENLYPKSDFQMSFALLDRFTQQYIQAQRGPEVTFLWQGGEPTLIDLDFFYKAIELQKKYQPPGMRIFNSIQTNGTLLDDEWCAFFKANNFMVGLSLDGPSELHNTYRRDKAGKPTFDLVMTGLSLLKKHQVEFNILACINNINAEHPLKVYKFLRDEAGVEFIQFIPVIERHNETGYQKGHQVTDRSVTGKQYGDFFITIFDEWVRRDVGKVYVQLFDVALASWVGQRPGLCAYEDTCGAAMVMEHNGDIYSCDHYVEPDYWLGNITEVLLAEIVNLQQQRQFGKNKRNSLPRYCLECEVRFACNGGCQKNRVLYTPQGEPGLNFLCEGYKAFFKHIDQPMQIMANELKANRTPANIMRLLA